MPSKKQQQYRRQVGLSSLEKRAEGGIFQFRRAVRSYWIVTFWLLVWVPAVAVIVTTSPFVALRPIFILKATEAEPAGTVTVAGTTTAGEEGKRVYDDSRWTRFAL